MRYTEWIVNNWKESREYQSLVYRVKYLEEKLEKLRIAVAQAERGEIPVGYERLFEEDAYSAGRLVASYALFSDFAAQVDDMVYATMTGTDINTVRRQRWEREALNAEDRKREAEKREQEEKKAKFQEFLDRWRDGKCTFMELYPDSIPDLERNLAPVKELISGFVLQPPFDWRNRKQEDWYENAIKVLDDMLFVAGIDTGGFDFNEALSNYLEKLQMRFSFSIWLQKYDGATCIVRLHRTKKTAKYTGDNMWEAALVALLKIVDSEWEYLIQRREEMRTRLQKAIEEARQERLNADDDSR